MWLAALLACATLAAQDPTFHATFVDGAGAPLAGVAVTDGAQTWTSDAQGRVSVPLKKGALTSLRATAKGAS